MIAENAHCREPRQSEIAQDRDPLQESARKGSRKGHSRRLKRARRNGRTGHEGAIVGFVVIVVAVMVGIFAYDFISASSLKSGA